ncbi:hypothetical protein [Ligilactobacillus faecis]|nr:hypothetical protein [Ligilactobacillus faecis]WGN89549.1 hypothetical protein QFX10_00115 [Ligilactobacillus faecis]
MIKLNNRLGKLSEPYMIVTDETHHSKARNLKMFTKSWSKEKTTTK